MRVYAKHIVQRKSDSVSGSRQHHHPAPKGKPVSPPFSPRTARRPGQPDYLQGKGRRVGLLQNSGRRQMAEFRKKGGEERLACPFSQPRFMGRECAPDSMLGTNLTQFPQSLQGSSDYAPCTNEDTGSESQLHLSDVTQLRGGHHTAV